MYTKYPMSDKIKVAVYLDKELDDFLEKNRGEELKKTQYIRIILRQEMRRKEKKVKPSVTTVNDPFKGSCITSDLIPDDLKQYSELLIEWWPIRKQKGGSCTESVANRIFKTLRSFPLQDRKEALEKAITGGWKDIYPLKKGYKPEEPKNNHPASRVFTAKRGFE
jgi:hypothetical protein